MLKTGLLYFDGKSYKDVTSAVNVAGGIAKELHDAMSSLNPLYGGTDIKKFDKFGSFIIVKHTISIDSCGIVSIMPSTLVSMIMITKNSM